MMRVVEKLSFRSKLKEDSVRVPRKEADGPASEPPLIAQSSARDSKYLMDGFWSSQEAAVTLSSLMPGVLKQI